MKLDQNIVTILCPADHALIGSHVVKFDNCDWQVLEQNLICSRIFSNTTSKVEFKLTMALDQVAKMPTDLFKVDDITINMQDDDTIHLTAFFATQYSVNTVSLANNIAELVIVGFGTLEVR